MGKQIAAELDFNLNIKGAGDIALHSGKLPTFSIHGCGFQLRLGCGFLRTCIGVEGIGPRAII
jgi:hypothetical protein